jgi:cysteine-rich repeat protein
MRRLRGAALAALAAAALSGCAERTYVVVSVAVDPALQPAVAQLRVVGHLMLGGVELTRSEGFYPDPAGSEPVAFPSSYIVVADGLGHDGESLLVLVELRDASGATVGRARGEVAIQPGKQSTLELLVRAPCATVDDCLAGGTFCARPQRCVCESTASCAEGVCEPLPFDDSNECTTDGCDEASRVVTHVAVADGTSCQPLGSSADPIQCLAGLCACGDGITNPAIEECDEGPANADASNRCRLHPPCTLPRCGDGIKDDGPAFGEECDNGAANAWLKDACRLDCTLPRCGDGIQDTGEDCDDGFHNADAPDACRLDCTLPRCGDGIIDSGEECDDGKDCTTGKCNDEDALHRRPLACRESCRFPWCGDGVKDNGTAFPGTPYERVYTERCDDGNNANGDACNPTCTLENTVELVAGGPGGAGSADGVGPAARIHDPIGMVVVGGYAYFTADENHTTDPQEDHVIRRLTLADGTVTTVAGTTGQPGLQNGAAAEARFSQPRGLAVAGNTLFLADSANNVVRSIDLSSGTVATVAGSGTLGSANGALASAQFAYPRLVAARSSTELFVMDSATSEGCDLRRVDLTGGQVTTVAGDGTCTLSFRDGLGTAARFYSPQGMALSADGNTLYVTDYTAVRKVDLTQSPVVVSTVAGAFQQSFLDAIGTAARFRWLGAVVATASELYIADRGNHVIRTLDLASMQVSTVVGAPQAPGVTDSPPRFDGPRALGLGTNLLVVGELTSHVLRVVDLPGYAVRTVAGRREQLGTVPPTPPVDGPALTARFYYPAGLVALGGDVYVADEQSCRVRHLTLGPTPVVATLPQTPGDCGAGDFVYYLAASPDGRLFGTYAGQRIFQLAPDTGAPMGLTPDALSPVLLSTLGEPRGCAVLGDHLYVTDPPQSYIRRVHLGTGAVEVFAGDGNAVVADGYLSEARFNAPTGVVACGGALYVTETGVSATNPGNVIRKIDLGTGYVTTIAGSPSLTGWRDGLGGLARFDRPAAIACDGQSLYIADSGNHVVRQLVLDTGEATTLAGVAGESCARDGVGRAARFNNPQGLAYDAVSGNLYVTDRDEHLVRRIR